MRVKIKDVTRDELLKHLKAVRHALNECQDAASAGDFGDAYAAAERAQHAAFELKDLFAPEFLADEPELAQAELRGMSRREQQLADMNPSERARILSLRRHPSKRTTSDTQCTESSVQTIFEDPYGPDGRNRCIHPAGGHAHHKDDYGNVFIVRPAFEILQRGGTEMSAPTAPAGPTTRCQACAASGVGVCDDYPRCQ